MMWSSTRGSRTHAIDHQVPSDRVLDEAFWRRMGSVEQPTMREKIILVSIDDLGRVGPATFNVKLVCEALGVSFSLINHHFGSRDRLIAEATLHAYKAYVEELWAKASREQAPDDRLRAWLLAAVEWTSAHSGISAILNYPTASLDVTEIITQSWREELRSWGELNLARLHQLVLDVRQGQVTNRDFTLGDLPLAEFRQDSQAMLITGSIALSNLGMCVWSAGKHMPSSRIEDVRTREDAALRFHVDQMIKQARGA